MENSGIMDVLDQRDKHPLKEYINVQEIRDAVIKGYENVTGKRYLKKRVN